MNLIFPQKNNKIKKKKKQTPKKHRRGKSK